MKYHRILQLTALVTALCLLFCACSQAEEEVTRKPLGDFGSQPEISADAFGATEEEFEFGAENQGLTENDEGTRSLTERDAESGDGVGIYSYLQTLSAYD